MSSPIPEYAGTVKSGIYTEISNHCMSSRNQGHRRSRIAVGYKMQLSGNQWCMTTALTSCDAWVPTLPWLHIIQRHESPMLNLKVTALTWDVPKQLSDIVSFLCPCWILSIVIKILPCYCSQVSHILVIGIQCAKNIRVWEKCIWRANYTAYSLKFYSIRTP